MRGLPVFEIGAQRAFFIKHYAEPSRTEWVALHECTHLLTFLIDESAYFDIRGLESDIRNAVDSAITKFPAGPKEISTELLVVTTRPPVDLAALTADRDFLNRATSTTGGRLIEMNDIAAIPSTFGAPKEI